MSGFLDRVKIPLSVLVASVPALIVAGTVWYDTKSAIAKNDSKNQQQDRAIDRLVAENTRTNREQDVVIDKILDQERDAAIQRGIILQEQKSMNRVLERLERKLDSLEGN